MSEILTEQNDSEEDVIVSTDLTIPNKPRGRMTKAREAEWIKQERQRVIRAKLAEIENIPDDIKVDNERARVVKFSEEVEEKVMEEIGKPKVKASKKK